MSTFDPLALGEDASTMSVPDAHWCDYYRGLVSFDETLQRLKRQVVGLSGDSRRDASRRAMPGLIADSEMFQRRFDFWEGRLAQLSRRFKALEGLLASPET